MSGKILPFPSVLRSSTQQTTKPASVTNLWVKRTERERSKTLQDIVWACQCGYLYFNWYRLYGLVCARCGKFTTPRQ